MRVGSARVVGDPATAKGKLRARANETSPGVFDCVVVDAEGTVIVRLDGYRTVPLPAPIPDDVAADLHADLPVVTGTMSHGDGTSAIYRLGILDRGESAVRVLHAVGGLNGAGDAPLITTVLFHSDSGEATPWDGREADEVRSVAGEVSDEAIVADLQQAHIDTLWLGCLVAHQSRRSDRSLRNGWDRRRRTRLVDDPPPRRPRRAARAARAATARSRPACPTRRIEVDVLADAHGGVWTLDSRDVSVRRDGASLIAEAPCTTVGVDVCQRVRVAAVELAAASTTRVWSPPCTSPTASISCWSTSTASRRPEHATTEERTGASIIGLRLRLQRGEALPSDTLPDDGVTVEARLLAEDSDDGVRSHAGTL